MNTKVGLVSSKSNFFINKISQGRKSVREKSTFLRSFAFTYLWFWRIFTQYFDKVHILWEGHKIWKNFHFSWVLTLLSNILWVLTPESEQPVWLVGQKSKMLLFQSWINLLLLVYNSEGFNLRSYGKFVVWLCKWSFKFQI